MADEPEKVEEEKTTVHGGRNLILLGLISIIIAVTTTAVILFIYRATGDIYLDRSRPGFIAEGEQHNEEDDSHEVFPNEGPMNQEAFDKNLEELDLLTERIDGSSDSFAGEPLSDDSLGIIIYEDEED